MESVLTLLRGTRSSERSERVSSEQKLNEFSQNNEQFLPLLLSIANSDADVADKQSAMLTFKTCVQRFWSVGFEQFTGPPLTHELRAQLRSELMSCLVNTAQTPKVRDACALVIGQIGSLEYPDQWPDLVQITLSLLSEPFGSPVILSGLALFQELLLDCFREEDFMEFGDQICRQLYLIIEYFLNAQKSSPLESHLGAILKSVQCFHSCVTFLLMGDDDQLPHLDNFAASIVPSWVHILCQVLHVCKQDHALVSEVYNTLREMESAFSKIMSSQLSYIYRETTQILNDTEFDQFLLTKYTLLLVLCLDNSQTRSEVFKEGETSLFCKLLLKLSVLTPDQLELYEADFNVFVSDELELGELTSRTNSAQLISMTSQLETLQILISMLLNTQSDAYLLESNLFLIMNLLTQADLPTEMMKQVPENDIQLFLNVLEFNKSNTFLNARRMVLASCTAKYVGDQFSEELKSILATHMCRYPDILSANELLKCAALRAFGFSSNINLFKYLMGFQELGLQLVFSLLKTEIDDDTPAFLAEVFGSVLKIDYKIVERQSECVHILLSLAALNPSDIDLNAQILDVVGELLDSVNDRQVVNAILQPVLAVVENVGLKTNFSYSSELYFALELMSAVLSNEKVSFQSDEIVKMLDCVYQVITSTDDSQILQVSSFAYAALVNNIDTKSANPLSMETANNMLKVAARLLSPDLDDSAALASGKLVSAIIDQFGDTLGDVLFELLVACAKRLSTATNALLVETLVMVFCELTLRNAKAVVDILAESNMLESVFKQWIPTFEVTIGADNIRKQIKAMQLLFELNDPRLQQLMVPDEPIRTPGMVMTRRRAKNLEFTKVSVPVKILKLLIRELSQGEQSTQDIKKTESDDEWDDELVITEEGEFFDQVAYNLILSWFKKLSTQPGMMEYYEKLNEHERGILMRALNH